MPVDPDPQNTYLSDAVRDNLQLDSVTKENVVISKFGRTSGQFKELSKFKFSFWGLHENGFVVHISGFSVPVVSSPVRCQKTDFFKNRYSFLQDLKLADS